MEIFEQDAEAIQKLNDQIQAGGPLTKFLDEFEPDVRSAAIDTLLNGFEAGEPIASTARKLKDITGIERDLALIVVQTVTNQAYREASLDSYKRLGIDRYFWASPLDPRTCWLCWALHGQIFEIGRRPLGHAGCRCTVEPLTDTQGPSKTGEDLFAELEPGYQKQILGPTRYESYRTGSRLRDLIEPIDDFKFEIDDSEEEDE